MAERRRTFVPVAGLGLASATLLTVASTKAWATARAVDEADDLLLGGPTDTGGQVPLVTALGLVVLATWGVVLVTRGRFRRLVSALGAFAAVSALGVAISAYWLLPDLLQTQVWLVEVTADYTGWYVAGLVGAVVAVVASALGVAWVPDWPEMGSRYDAPSAPAVDDSRTDDQSNLDLWKAIDEGRDPTQGRS